MHGEPECWLNRHPAVSFFQEFAVLVLTHPTNLAPQNQRSFRELIGSSECFPGQYHRSRGDAIFHATYAGLPLLRFLLFSTFQSRASVSAEVLILRCRFCPRTDPLRHVQGLVSDPLRAFSRRDLRLFLSKKASAPEVTASAFQGSVTNRVFFRSPLSYLAISENGRGCLIRTAAAFAYGFAGLILTTEPPWLAYLM
jgi:hypothetical protein